jgi:dTDP-4-amino-4,6-dideoxygalactose transaminase
MTTMSYQRAQGHATSYDIEELGYNYRMDDIRASIGIIQLKKLKEDLEKRIILRELYVQKLKSHDKITLPFIHNNEFVSNYIFPIVLNNADDTKRNKIRDSLHKHGIQTSIHYPAVHQFSVYKSLEIVLPFTEYVSNNEITLPLYGSLTREEVIYICDKLCDSLNYER